MGLVLSAIAKEVFSSLLNSFADDAAEVAKSAAKDAARDTVERVITGRRSLQDWAELAIQGVDEIKNRAVEEGNLRFVGGKLIFALSGKKLNKVVITLETNSRQWMCRHGIIREWNTLI